MPEHEKINCAACPSRDNAVTQAKIERAGGQGVKPVFPFPVGRRFHFYDPDGNECATCPDRE